MASMVSVALTVSSCRCSLFSSCRTVLVYWLIRMGSDMVPPYVVASVVADVTNLIAIFIVSSASLCMCVRASNARMRMNISGTEVAQSLGSVVFMRLTGSR